MNPTLSRERLASDEPKAHAPLAASIAVSRRRHNVLSVVHRPPEADTVSRRRRNVWEPRRLKPSRLPEAGMSG